MSAQARLRTKVAAKESAAEAAVFERAAKRRIQEFVLFSKPLFSSAYKFAQARGRGAYLQIWTSLAEADDMLSARPALHYIPFDMVQKLGYAPACELTKSHDVFSMFVVIVAIQTNDERDSIMCAALLPASMSDTVLPALETTIALQRLNVGDNTYDDTAASNDPTTIPFTALLCPLPPPIHAVLCINSSTVASCASDAGTQAGVVGVGVGVGAGGGNGVGVGGVGGGDGGGGCIGSGSGDVSIASSTTAPAAATSSSSSSGAAAHPPRLTLASLFGDSDVSPHSLAAGLSVAAVGEPPLVLSLISTMCALPTCERVYHLPLVSLTANASIIGGGDKQHVASIESVPSFATSVSADTSSATAANVGVNQDSCPYFPVSAAAFDQRTFCGQCFLLTYCSAECQRQHWHTSHHGACQRVRASFIAQYLHVHESLQSTAPNKQSKKKKKKLFTL